MFFFTNYVLGCTEFSHIFLCFIHAFSLLKSAYGNLGLYVGEDTVKQLASGCFCSNNKFGPFCEWNQPDKNYCEHGKLQTANFLSLCECKNDDDSFTHFHGWYCEVHNSVLCTNYKYYDKSRALSKVGDNNGCRTCENVITGCKECEQGSEPECESNNCFTND